MTLPAVARMQEITTRARRVVLVARVTQAIPEGAWVGLVRVRDELFLQVVTGEAADVLTLGQVEQAARRGNQ